MPARREVPVVDVPLGKRSCLHPVDPYRNWDIDPQHRRMLHPDAPPVGQAVCKDPITRAPILRLTRGNLLRTRAQERAYDQNENTGV